MSIELVVYLRRSLMPSLDVWQRAVRENGFPVEVDHDFDPDTFIAFLPCKLRGSASGFEYFVDQISETDRVEVGAPPGTDFSVTFVTHADLGEFACSVAAAGSLARASGGVLVDAQSGETLEAAAVVAWALEQFADAERG